MSLTSPLPTYNDVANALNKTAGNFDAAQTHGLMCGLICATSGKADTRWENLILGEKKNPEAHEVLLELYETSYHQMSEFSFEFSLLLPDDSVDINVRTEALGLWCQGFITGLEQGNIAVDKQPPGDVSDALNDIIEISQVSYGDLTDDDEDETAYFELVEYVRLAIIMIFYELRAGNIPETAEDNSLH